MAKERDTLLEHEYDGIKEYDNPLPRWWLWLFYASILFAIFYIPYMMLGFGPSSAEDYEQEMAAAAKTHQASPTEPAATEPAGSAPAGVAPAASLDLEGNKEAIAAGKTIFAANCAPCHGPQGQGNIGPNLTDNYWLRGNTYADVVHTITNGVTDKGMPTWGSILGPTKIAQVAAFVKSLKGTHPPNPKPPQGKEYPN